MIAENWLGVTALNAVGNKAGVRFLQRRKWDTKPRLLASIEKAKKLIGYEPKTSFKEGLMKTIDWFREKWEYIEKSASFGPGISSAVRDR
jgi:nucleoside-diphosphate-sugar epimerase